MTACTATPSAWDLVNDGKNGNRKAPQSQARTTWRQQWRDKGLKTLERLGGLKPKLSRLHKLACNLQAESLEGLFCNP